MVENTSSQSEGKYEIIKNAAGEIMILITYRAGGPENPLILYDGGEEALLYRSRESSVMLGNIHVEARPLMKVVAEVLMVEVEGNEVAREYNVPVRHVKNLEALLK